ncbi:MAG: histidine kinase dimerization/phosphoacceptor domain-containing protein, partial [Gammaproteobacteria bacterium]|nr:histidine kinase dimerization/phosphoacceptor domain-containing protein [Gammaproteobacteria bacterium]
MEITARPLSRITLLVALLILLTGLAILTSLQLGKTYSSPLQANESGFLAQPSSSIQQTNIAFPYLLISGTEDRVQIRKEFFINIPDRYPTYQQYNEVFEFQGKLYLEASKGSIVLENEANEKITLETREISLSDFALKFWLMHAMAIIAVAVGFSVWYFRPQDKSAILFLLSGLGFYLINYSTSIYSDRTILLPEATLRFFSELGHFGGLLFRYSLLALFWNYPKPLHTFPVTRVLFFVMALLWLNQTMQWFEWPIHAFHVHSNLPTFLLMVGFILFQWRAAGNDPLARASLRWMGFAIAITTGLAIALYFVPLALGTQPITSPTTTLAIVLLMYLGISLGVRVHNLFEVDRYWLNANIWFFTGFLVIAFDVSLVFFFQMNSSLAVALSLAFVGWLYFPLRQSLISRLLKLRQHNLADYLPLIVSSCTSLNSTVANQQWKRLLDRVFNPGAIYTGEPLGQAQISSNGVVLLTPSPFSKLSYTLEAKLQGRSLFNDKDIRLANELHQLARSILELEQQKKVAASQERSRILRDLHDDVGSRLLTLSHITKVEHINSTAREAIQSLREIMNSLDSEQQFDLEDVCEDWRETLLERCLVHG